jgi:hypothetical protein
LEILVGFDGVASEKFGEASHRLMPPEVHLPETVLSLNVALCHEEVVLGSGVNMGNAEAVTVDIYLPIEARKGDLPVGLGERLTLQDGDGNGSGDEEEEYQGEEGKEDDFEEFHGDQEVDMGNS